MRKVFAIVNCRVSSNEQLLNGSLPRQEAAVNAAASKLGAEVVKMWSGSVSSKAGTNVKRTDLLQMLEFCKANKSVRFAIFDEYDRFMRSGLEGPYFEVLFQQLGVKVWFASESDAFNGDAANAKLLRSLSAFKAEGSNEERQRKSISGQESALKQGRYPFVPKPGYMRGAEPGIPAIHPERGPALQHVLKRLAAGAATPTQALIELNESDFTKDHSPYKMDKFAKIAMDPFYAGIVEIHQQVDVRNPNGLHEPLITIEEHERLIAIILNKPKYQSGPNKNGNPKFPLNNSAEHVSCVDQRNKGRLVGFEHSNGKNSGKIYEKYRCRTCGTYWRSADLHKKITSLFSSYGLIPEARKEVLNALDIVWRQNDTQIHQDVRRTEQAIVDLKARIDKQVEDATDSSNATIKDNLLGLIDKKKDEVSNLEAALWNMKSARDNDRKEFMDFALSFVFENSRHYLQEYVSKENRLRCKQLVFPAGILINDDGKVYTPEVSIFYRLAAKKKDAEASENSHLVQHS